MFCGRSSPGLLLAGRLGTWLKHQDTNWLWNTFKSTTSINTHTPHENDTLQDQSKTNFNCLINCRHTKTKPVNTQATRVLYSSPRAEITNQFFGQFQNQLLDGERLQLVVNDDDGRMDSKQVKYKPRSIFNWNILLEPSSTLHYSTNDRIGGGGGGGSSCAAHHLYSCIRQSKWRGPIDSWPVDWLRQYLRRHQQIQGYGYGTEPESICWSMSSTSSSDVMMRIKPRHISPCFYFPPRRGFVCGWVS